MTFVVVLVLWLGSSSMIRSRLRVNGSFSQSGHRSLALMSPNFESDAGRSKPHCGDAARRHVQAVTILVASQVAGTGKLIPPRKDPGNRVTASPVGSWLWAASKEVPTTTLARRGSCREF